MFEDRLASIKRYFSFSSTTPACDRALDVLGMYEENLGPCLKNFVVGAAFFFLVPLFILRLIFANLNAQVPVIIGLLIISVAISVWSNARVRMVICDNGIEFWGMEYNIFPNFRKPIFCKWEDLSHMDVAVHSSRKGTVTTRSAVLNLKQPKGVRIDLQKIISVSILHNDNGKWLLNKREYDVVDPDALANSHFGRTYLAKYAPQVIEAARKRHQEAEAYIRSG